MAKGQSPNKVLLGVLVVAVVIAAFLLLMRVRGDSKDPEVAVPKAPSDLKPITPEEMANGPQPKSLK